MGFLHLWPLWLLLLIPIIIIMYLMKQKMTDCPFPSLFLWTEMYKNKESNTPWEKLKKNILLILQLITVVVLVVALMSPYLITDKALSERVVLVIDNSGSMNTMYDETHTRLEKAKEQAVMYVEELKSDTNITVITSARDAALIASDMSDRQQVIKRIKEIEPTNYLGSASEGIKLAETFCMQFSSAEVITFTDSPVAYSVSGAYVMDFCNECENLGIEQVSYGTTNGKMVVLVKVTNYGISPMASDINLYGDDKLLSVQEVSLGKGDSTVVYFEDVVFDGKVLTAEINNKDALNLDNVASVIIQENNTKKVLLVTEQNLYLEKAVMLYPGVQVVKTADVEAFDSFEKEGYDLYIFDGMQPKRLPAKGNLILIGCDDSEFCNTQESMENKVVEIERTDASKYVGKLSFGVSKAKTLVKPVWADSIFKIGNGSAGFIGNNGGRTICVIGFDLHDSDLPLKADFPVLIYGIMSETVSTNVLSENVIYAGGKIALNISNDVEKTVVEMPSGKKNEYELTMFDYKDTYELGVYTVSTGNSKEYFAVNFPKAESGSVGVIETTVGSGAKLIDVSENNLFNTRNLIIILAIVFLAIEWIYYIKE